MSLGLSQNIVSWFGIFYFSHQSTQVAVYCPVSETSFGISLGLTLLYCYLLQLSQQSLYIM